MPLSIGQTIKELRKQEGMTQEELAEHIGVTPQAVSKWELGAALPDITLIQPLAKIFNVTADALLKTDPPTQKADPGKMLRELREQTGMTQKWLAELLNQRASKPWVTALLVDDWENGAAEPPAILQVQFTEIFGDDKEEEIWRGFGHEKDYIERKLLQSILDAASSAGNDFEKHLIIFKDGLRRLPNHQFLLSVTLGTTAHLAAHYFKEGNPKAKSMYDEAEKLAVRLNCLDVENKLQLQSSTEEQLIGMYAGFSEFEKAKERAQRLPDSRDILARIEAQKGDLDGEISQRKNNVTSMLNQAALQIVMLALAYERKGDYTREMESVKAQIALAKAAACGDAGALQVFNIYNLCQHAEIALQRGDLDTCFEWLELYLDYELSVPEFTDNCSPIMQSYRLPRRPDELKTEKLKWRILSRLEMHTLAGPFEAIRQDLRFKALLARIDAINDGSGSVEDIIRDIGVYVETVR